MKWYLLGFPSFTRMINRGNLINIIMEYVTETNILQETFIPEKSKTCKAFHCQALRGNGTQMRY